MPSYRIFIPASLGATLSVAYITSPIKASGLGIWGDAVIYAIILMFTLILIIYHSFSFYITRIVYAKK